MNRLLHSVPLLAVLVALLSSCDGGASTGSSSDGSASGTGGTWNKKEFGIPWNSSVNYGTITDARDGLVYRTVKIGTQTWMAENLNFQVDSSWWYLGPDCSKPDTSQPEGCDSTDDVVTRGARFGRLYTWAAAMGFADSCNVKRCSSQVASVHRGVCPLGWHIPSSKEWIALFHPSTPDSLFWDDSIGVDYMATAGWVMLDSAGNLDSVGGIRGRDRFGFRALPAGYREPNRKTPRFRDAGINAGWISAMESAGNNIRSFIGAGVSSIGGVGVVPDFGKSYGNSARCLKDGS